MTAATAMAGKMATNEREHVLERLHHLRTILPAFAEELASSRRQAAALRVENRSLLEEVRRLRALHGHSHSGHSHSGRSSTVRG